MGTGKIQKFVLTPRLQNGTGLGLRRAPTCLTWGTGSACTSPLHLLTLPHQQDALARFDVPSAVRPTLGDDHRISLLLRVETGES